MLIEYQLFALAVCVWGLIVLVILYGKEIKRGFTRHDKQRYKGCGGAMVRPEGFYSSWCPKCKYRLFSGDIVRHGVGVHSRKFVKFKCGCGCEFELKQEYCGKGE